MKTLAKYADAIVIVDNGAFMRPGESLKSAYQWINSEIVKRFSILARSGEVTASGNVGEMVVDASEIAQTINGMEICTIGYASEELPRGGSIKKAILGKQKPDQRKSARILSLVTRAAKTRLLLPSDFRLVRKALVVVAGPPDELSRDGIERSREWLEKNIAGGEVRGGDYPVQNSRFIAVAVLLGGISGVHKIDNMFERARKMQEAVATGLTKEEAKKVEKTAQLMQFIDDLESEEATAEELEDLLKDLEV
jgi:cell division GTPase FtsZ